MSKYLVYLEGRQYPVDILADDWNYESAYGGGPYRAIFERDGVVVAMVAGTFLVKEA